MGLEVHFRLEYHKLLIQAFLIKAEEMVVSKVNLESIVVQIILLLPACLPPVADMAPFVLVPTVSV